MRGLITINIIDNKDLDLSDIERYKEIISKTSFSNKEKEESINCLETIYKIADYKKGFVPGDNKNLQDAIDFLESNYYNKNCLTKMVDRVLKTMFTPPYYQGKKHVPFIPYEFWSSNLGKIILSCLCVSGDLLVSTSEAATILGYSRQNMNILAREKKIPSRRSGNFIVFNLFDILSYKYKDLE